MLNYKLVQYINLIPDHEWTIWFHENQLICLDVITKTIEREMYVFGLEIQVGVHYGAR